MKFITLDVLKRAVEAQLDPISALLVERAILLGAYNLVVKPDSGDVRGAIDAIVYSATCDYSPDIIKRAVTFFTATECTFETLNACEWRFRSVGYRAGPAGDH